MKRALLVALVVAGCNGLVGIESASFTPIATEAGTSPDGGTAEAGSDSGPTLDAGPCSQDLDTDPHHCGVCSRDCGGGICAGGKCQAYTVLSEASATYESVATDADNVYFIDRTSAALERAPINGGGPSTVMFTGDPTNGIAADIVVEGGFVYFIDDLTVTDESGKIARCPVTGCDAAGPETVVEKLTAPTAFAIDTSGTIVVATGGPGGQIVKCTQPPCLDATFSGVVNSQNYITQVGISGTAIAWTQTGDIQHGGSPSITVLTLLGSHQVELAFGILDMTMTQDHVYYGSPQQSIRASTFDGPPRTIGVSETTTNLANDGSFVYWVEGASGVIWKIGVADTDVATKLASNQNNPSYVAVDDTSVTWLNNPTDGSKSAIVRLVK